MCEQTGRCDTPPWTQCIFTAGRVVALRRVGPEQGSSHSLHQQQKPKNSGRDGVNTVEDKLSTRGTELADFQEGSGFLGGLARCRQRARRRLVFVKWPAADRQKNTSIQTHTCRLNSPHLLIVAQLVIQDDAVGLLRLWPRQCEAVHGRADLVHDGNYGGSCRAQRDDTQ